MTDQTSPDSASADDPVTILRGWAKAYRDSPEHRFPSDPDAEFFPVDLELAAFEIERLRADYRFLTESWHVAKRNQFAAEAIARSRDHAQTPAVPDLREDCANLEYMKNAHEERIAELQYEAGMYKSLYENAIERCALVAEGFDAACNSPRMKLFEEAGLVIAVYKRDGEIGAAIRALADTSTDRPADCPLCPGFSTPCGNTNCPQLVSSPDREAGK